MTPDPLIRLGPGGDFVRDVHEADLAPKTHPDMLRDAVIARLAKMGLSTDYADCRKVSALMDGRVSAWHLSRFFHGKSAMGSRKLHFLLLAIGVEGFEL